MAFEIEIKYRVPDHADLRARLAARGAEARPAVAHADTYLAHPGRDFSQSGEAFRVRTEGAANRITYKGPKLGGPAKTREEIEVDFEPGDASRADLLAVLDRLGFRPVATVRKRRVEYPVRVADRALTVTLDEAEGLGTFAEVEVVVDSEADLAAAQASVGALAAELGLIEVEPRSYLRMTLAAAGRLPRNPPGQT